MINSKVLLQNPVVGSEIKLLLSEAVLTYGKALVVPELYENSTIEEVELLVSLQDRAMFYPEQEAFIKMADNLWLKFKIEKLTLDPPLYVKITGEALSWVTV